MPMKRKESHLLKIALEYLKKNYVCQTGQTDKQILVMDIDLFYISKCTAPKSISGFFSDVLVVCDS